MSSFFLDTIIVSFKFLLFILPKSPCISTVTQPIVPSSIYKKNIVLYARVKVLFYLRNVSCAIIPVRETELQDKLKYVLLASAHMKLDR